MQLPRRRQADFEAHRDYAYPEHLRACVANLPAAPGVYVFHGAVNELPLYIGKSVNLRARVQSHCRNPDEARMLRQTTSVCAIPTAGELGALLLEAQMIKQQQPVFNQKLRRNRQLCALRVLPDRPPEVAYSHDSDFARDPNLYGLYGSRTSALQALRDLADAHRLCYGALGLEKLAKGRGCFRSMLGQCAGVCCTRETAASHQERLMTALQALQIKVWPYAGPIGLVEPPSLGSAVATQIHVLHNWCYLGSVARIEEAAQLRTVAAGFDADGYKILCKPVLQPNLGIIPL